ncbi:MAG: Teichuronic acid biosynthesis protein TuaB [Chlamydiae bacterium]|nr:Teichuronic acid biosynthesis protein TuaB [Chlamydiota bacterium]
MKISNKSNLKSLVIKSSQWIFFGYGMSQVIRIGIHLILARFLLPEYFGFSQIINVFVQGMIMFCDLGMGLSIIQHKDGEEPVFLQTVWTLNIIRGLFLWGITFLIAYPVSYVYETPEIVWLLPLAGSSLFLIGFTSTNYWVQNRRMSMSTITLIDLFSNVLGCVVMLGCAWYWRDVWTLLVGSIVFGSLRAILSHIFLDGPRMMFRCDWKVVKEVFHFGKWIFLSTVNAFLTSRIDILIMGLYLDKRSLGYYGIASRIVNLFYEGLAKLNGTLLIPFYSRIKNEKLTTVRRKSFRIRFAIICFFLPVFFTLVIWGQDIVNFLYPENFHSVGVFLRILAVGGAIKATASTITPIFIARGDSFRQMLTQVSHSLLLIIPMFIGGHYFAEKGLIFAIVFSHLFNYPVVIFNIRRYGVWFPVLDFSAFALTLFIAASFLRGNFVLPGM